MANKIWVQLTVPVGSYRDPNGGNANTLVVNQIPTELYLTPNVQRAIQAGRLRKIDANDAKALLMGQAAPAPEKVEAPVPPAPPAKGPAGKGDGKPADTPPAPPTPPADPAPPVGDAKPEGEKTDGDGSK